jgi:uncharacterized protein (DUF2147 family)
MKSLLVLALTFSALAQDVPIGLWRSQDEGFVIRIEACGDALCGFAAGAPPTKKNAAEICGKQMLREFRWNNRKKLWEGTMHPPNAGVSINASLTQPSPSELILKGRMMIMSKTMRMSRFNGVIGAGCRIE